MMNNEQATTWLVVHIYYNEPWEHFLYASVLPFVDTTVKTGMVEQFFFVRYWERGPHLRLFLKAENASIEAILKPNLEEHFKNYMERYPSVRIDPNYPNRFPTQYKWHSNNTLQYAPYIQSQSRFGGKRGVAICEEQFYYSTQTVLQALKNTQDSWTYDDAMGNAIQLHLTFAHAMGMDVEETTAFFSFFYKNCLQKPSSLLLQSANQRRHHPEMQETEQTYERAFGYRSEVLRRHLNQLWNALDTNYEQLSKHLQTWHFNNQVICRKLQAAIKQSELEIRPLEYQYPVVPLDKSKQLLWSFYADFIHFTNNRLGVVARDESFVAYIIMKSMEDLGINTAAVDISRKLPQQGR